MNLYFTFILCIPFHADSEASSPEPSAIIIVEHNALMLIGVVHPGRVV